MQLASTIDRDFAREWREWGEGKMDIAAWTWEGHDVASTVTYADLRPRIPIEPPTAGFADRAACDAGRARVAGLHISIDQEYTGKTLPAIERQLAKGGYRLALALNQIFR